MTPDQAVRVLQIAESGETSLKALAHLTGLDPFNFYQGADLRELDLSGQDLTGLNFTRADLRFAIVDNISFDPGSFNGCDLDENQKWLADEYEFFSQDIVNHPSEEVLVFCRIRPEIIEKCIRELGVTYQDFSGGAGISSNALRKCRRGQVIAYETAKKVIEFIEAVTADIRSNDYSALICETFLRQPNFQLLSGGLNMPFKHVSRSRLREIVAMREEIKEIRALAFGHDPTKTWRETPEYIEHMIDYYRYRLNPNDQSIMPADLSGDFTFD